METITEADFWPGERASSLFRSDTPEVPVATVLWDYQEYVPLVRISPWNKPLVLFTPLVPRPASCNPEDKRDPFEILGQSISGQNIAVSHVPYTQRLGITKFHEEFIMKARAKAVIFIITQLADSDYPTQFDYAEFVSRVYHPQPFILLVCCDITGRDIPHTRFRTVVHVDGYSNANLLAAASVLLSHGPSLAAQPAMDAWTVQPWVAERDLAETCALWQACLPYQFNLNEAALGSLLHRDGFALHYIVRDPSQGALIGVCVAYTTFADTSNENLTGSIAAVIVHDAYRGRGIGSLLYTTAINKFRGVRGVKKVQLGTTFPRLLCGVTPEMPIASRWFARRGWPVHNPGPEDESVLVADWILQFAGLSGIALPVPGLKFRQCSMADKEQVLDMKDRPPATSNHGFGWYSQYEQMLRSEYIGDIVVGFTNTGTMVATAITYIPGQPSPAANDIPWPGSLGNNLGGVTCICVRGKTSPRPPFGILFFFFFY